ncbi:site-specific DNA-methyltransferase [Aedoeadaptatus coxii]|uniref:site-specific DNA-methyltransferase n=1 Tax=Aedoeadaptatus coxii TaxID=755172 RepID=UPI002AD3B572|nr:site-specific DNA-methyltransferase [Peptoniphilus coxii]
MKLLEELNKALSADERFTGEDNQIIKTKVSDAARSNDEKLLKALLKNELLKESFFTEIDEIYVFDKNKFVWVLESKEFLPDSYTLYKNKIGLVDANNNLISQGQDVSLVWPYKDCVLEGGQTKEDQKRNEIFYNETLAPDQVSRLLAPKALGNAKRYTKDGVEEDIEFNEDDNLIIKGNNLLSLSSLLDKYEGKIQLIYIDPPFNTGKDTFKYNDKFNHSTWLTFMKNRLLIAKRLLKSSGSIFVHLDSNEIHYTKVLMDDIFEKENFKNHIIWCYTGPSGSSRFLPRKHDDILYYGVGGNTLFNQPFVKHKSGVHNTGQVYGNTESKEDYKEKAEAQGKKLEDWWDDIYSTDRYRSELLNFEGQKPEKLLQRIIEIGSNEGDIVLDYHLGSGTTAAVAHKLKRKYIGLEQMDEQILIELDRLVKVINGIEFGISNEVNWQGGGSFVYCELLEDSENLVSELDNAKNTDHIKTVLNKAIDNGKLIPSVLPSDLKDNEEKFDKLSLDEQKNLVMDLLNKNKLYVNLSDIDDEDYAISEADKKFTKSFYGKE